MAQITSLQIETLKVTGFGRFAAEQEWAFGPMTTVTGHNAQGKSTIADAIAYALTGAPFFGGRDLDHLHHTDAPFLRVEMLVRTDDGQTHEIRRVRHNSKSILSVDGTTTTQERFAERFGSRDLILSLLNPLYFTEVLGGSGRKLIEQYLPPVPHEAVMAKLSEHMRGILGDDRLEMPEVYLKDKRDALKELEKDRLVLDGQMQQTENQRAKLQKELNEKQALLAHTAAALEPLARKQQAHDTSAIQTQIAELNTQYDAVTEGHAEQERAQLQAEIDAAQQRQYESPGTAQLRQMQNQLQLLYGKYNDEAGRLNYLQQQGVSFFAGQQVLARDIVIHHQNICFIVRVLPNDNRKRLQSDHSGAIVAPMTGENFITALCTGSHNQRLRNPHLLDAVHQTHQIRCWTFDRVWLPRIRMKFFDGNVQNALPTVLLTIFFALEHIIE